MGVGDGGTVGIGVSSIGIGVSSVEKGISISVGLPLLAAGKVGVSVVSVTGITGVSGITGGAWYGNVGSVDARSGLEWGNSVGVGESGVWETGVEESWVSLGLGLSFGVDSGHDGEENNLEENDESM